MAAATATLSPFSSMIRASSKLCDTTGSGTLPIGYEWLQRRHVVAAKSGEIIKMPSFSRKLKRGNLIRASVTEQQQEEATQISTPQEEEDKEKIVEEEAAAGSPSGNPVSVSVSPSDLLTMFFQAEGTMTETAVPTVTNALEEIEGISNLKIQLLEGIASVELTKQTTVQATGVASSLVEIIQGSGFKLQTLNLSFEDEEDIN